MSSSAPGPSHRALHLKLQPGQSHMLQAASGSHWQVLSGELRLQEPPRWLSENMVLLQHTLYAGQEHRPAQTGWIRLEASAPSELLCWPPVPAWRRWLQQLAGSRRGPKGLEQAAALLGK